MSECLHRMRKDSDEVSFSTACSMRAGRLLNRSSGKITNKTGFSVALEARHVLGPILWRIEKPCDRPDSFHDIV